MSKALTTISADELETALDGEHPPVLIITLPRKAHEAKHVPGSVTVPVDDIDRVDTHVPNKNEPIMVYCANANWTAAPKLEEMGDPNVSDFEKGYAGWREADYPLVGDKA